MKKTSELLETLIRDGLQEIFKSHEELAGLAQESSRWKEFDNKENWKDPELFRSDAFKMFTRIEQFLTQKNIPIERADAINEEVYDLLMNRAYYQLILKQESEWIKEKREKSEDKEREKLNHNFLGLALSGGGIRSATFNLGFIQALQRYKIFNSIDYLSTVSGGGYIGASQTWLRYVRPDVEFPFGSKRQDYGTLGGKVLAWMRDHGNYLSPGNGLNIWSLIGAFLGSVMVNLLILAPIFLLSVYLVYVAAPHKIFLFVGIFFIFWYVAKVIIYIFYAVGKRRPDFNRQRRERGSIGKILMLATLFLVISSIAPVYAFLAEHMKEWIGTVSLSTIFAGIVSFAGAYRESKKNENVPIGFEKLFLSIGVTLILYGLVIWIYHLFDLGHSGVELLFPLLISFGFALLIFLIPRLLKHSVEWALGFSLLLFVIAIAVIFAWYWREASLSGIGIYLLLSLPISALFAAYTKINYVSMHRYYRNRLMEAYFPWSVVNVPGEKADKFYLTQMKKPEKTPYPIINTNVNMVGSDSTRQRKRGGDNFIFSPLFCGSDITGYRSTEYYAGGKMNLATAFAISGAAVDPNTYATRSKPISFVMSLLNARLGYWIENPRKEHGADRIGWSYYLSIFKELFGKGLNEHETYIHLADGGHFENLGLYELVRRKCRHIIVTDAGKDPHFTFGDLAKVIELVRVDFGAEITLDTRPLRPEEKYKISKTAFIHGTIKYNDGKMGDIIYVKTTVVDGLSEDIYSYRRTNPKFPDQTTTDQYFDEMQFEAYRELGYQIGKNLCKGEEQDDYRSIFRGVPKDTALPQ